MTFCLTILFCVKELLESMIETRKLLKECGYDKAIINSKSNKMSLISSNGTIFEIADDDDDVYDYDDDNNNAGEDEDYSYCYNQGEEEGEEEEDSERDEEEKEEHNEEEEGENKEEKEENKEEEEENEEEEEENEEDDKEKPISEFAIKMGCDLHFLLKHINKLLSPPPTDNIHVLSSEEDYRKALINHLKSIKNADDFIDNENVFVPVNPPSSRERSLSFILNEEEENGDQRMRDNSNYDIFEHQININLDNPIINRDVVAKINDPSSLLTLPTDEFESQKKVACTIITNIIIRIYDTSLKDQLSNEIIRRRNFRHHVLFHDYYEKLSIYCNLLKVRPKGRTIKSQVIEMIVRSSKPTSQDPPRITNATILTVLNKAFRIKRLLAIASNNYNIVDAFLDLGSYFFTAKKMDVVNFERWLELVKTGELITFKRREAKTQNI